MSSRRFGIHAGRRSALAALLAALVALSWAAIADRRAAAQERGANSRHVALISLDGFAAYALADATLPVPHLRALAAQGARVDALVPVNPTVTWPNHTAMVTGVRPERHGLLVQRLAASAPQRAAQMPPVRIEAHVDKTTLVDGADGLRRRTCRRPDHGRNGSGSRSRMRRRSPGRSLRVQQTASTARARKWSRLVRLSESRSSSQLRQGADHLSRRDLDARGRVRHSHAQAELAPLSLADHRQHAASNRRTVASAPRRCSSSPTRASARLVAACRDAELPRQHHLRRRSITGSRPTRG